MISSDTLREFANKGKPFVIHLADRRAIEVPHGEHIAVHPGGQQFLLWKAKGGFEIFSLSLVTSVRPNARKKAGAAA